MNDPDNVVDPVVLAERRARRAELAEEELRELLREAELGTATLKGRLAAVEGELATARAQRDSLAADLARREKELLAATQREHTEQALRSEAQTRAAEAEAGSKREVEELRVRLAAAEQRAALLTEVEAEVAERLERAKAAEDELAALRGELQSRQSEITALRHELEHYAQAALQSPPSADVDPQLAARIAAERTAFAAQIAAVEHTIAGLRPQLAVAATALAGRLADERAARAEAERALEAERARVSELQEQVAATTNRQAAVLEVVAELQTAIDQLRERFAGDLDARVAELHGTAEALRAGLSEEQRLRAAAETELDRLRAAREEAAAELAREREQAAAARAELEHKRADHAALQHEFAAAAAELERRTGELREAQDRLEARETEVASLRDDLERRIADHSVLQDEIERQRAELVRLRSGDEEREADVERLRAAAEEARAELDALRREQAAAVAAKDARAAALEAEVQRLRAGAEEARAALEAAREERAALEGELDALRRRQPPGEVERLRAAAAEAQSVLEAAREEHEAAQAALEAAREEQASARVDLERRTAEHIALQAELAREQAGHEAAQAELGREQERRGAVEAELEALRSAPPPALDPQDLARAAQRLREQAPAPEEPEPERPVEPAAPPRPVEQQRDELARVLAAQQAAAERVAAPDRYAHLPEFPVKPVVPFAAGHGAWLREGVRRVGQADPALGAELLLGLTQVQAHAVRRKVAYQLTVSDAGTWRVELHDMTAAIEPGASDAKVAFRLSGTAGELAALLAGGGRRKLKAHIEGSRMALWRAARARRQAPTLAQAVAAGGDFSLQAILALLTAVAPEGGRGVVAFDDGDSPITAVATRRGAIVLRRGIEQPQATLHAPERDLVALLVGLAPDAPIRVSGNVEQAAAFVTRLHRAQGLV